MVTLRAITGYIHRRKWKGGSERRVWETFSARADGIRACADGVFASQSQGTGRIAQADEPSIENHQVIASHDLVMNFAVEFPPFAGPFLRSSNNRASSMDRQRHP